MQRVLLYVPFEEAPEAERAGALRDSKSKCWYIPAGQEQARFQRWMRPAAPAEHYSIVSEEAYVAAALTSCWRCHVRTEVICFYCRSGEVQGQRYAQFTVSNVTALAPDLEAQVARWPNFRLGRNAHLGRRYFANHCDSCGALQDDYFLHCEPGGVFFTLTGHAAEEAEEGSTTG